MKRRISLHITISTLFIALTLMLGGTLGWQNYDNTSRLILTAADQRYEQITRELELDFRSTYRPVVQTTSLLAQSSIAEADSLETRMSHVDLLITALNNLPEVSGIQVGYPNGDFFIVRPANDQQTRQQFNSPENTHLIIDHIVNNAGNPELLRIFADKDGSIVDQNSPVITRFDPRERPWYLIAERDGLPRITQPYLFNFLRQPGLTATQETSVDGVVVALDVTLGNFSQILERHAVTPRSEIALIDASGSIIGHPQLQANIEQQSGNLKLPHLSTFPNDVLQSIARNLTLEDQEWHFDLNGEEWVAIVKRVSRPDTQGIYAVMASPQAELLTAAYAQRQTNVIATLVIFALAIPLVWLLAHRISKPLNALAEETQAIKRFDFSSTQGVSSFISEVDHLSTTIDLMKTTISRFLILIESLSEETDFDRLLHHISAETLSASDATAVLPLTLSEDESCLNPTRLVMADEEGREIQEHLSLPLSALGIELISEDHGKIERFHLSDKQPHPLSFLLDELALESLELVIIPLRNRQHDLTGVLCLVFSGKDCDLNSPEMADRLDFVNALSRFAAVSIESRQLLNMQEALLDAFIKLLAGAIDAKSPYTGGHCQRVPAITEMLAKAACDEKDGPFADFQLNTKEWEALDIASWLHDCGKVTTPEYVVDKATKLETITDRIHEIRTRFEVIKRDEEITFWKKLDAGEDRNQLHETLTKNLATLDQEFAFVASCNLGGEFLDETAVAKLHSIGNRKWLRTLDNRLGVSWEELSRMPTNQEKLPVEETLLTNRVEHRIPRTDQQTFAHQNPYGFRMDVPEYKYDRGELHNLSVSRGTLTPEERFEINNHIVQTIIMLEALPYPKHLRDVPMIAGCHHESMDGKGYPRKLYREEMPTTARMMAIADIFEALTASDRPYKKAKPLSEALKIMRGMRDRHHVDPDLYALFIKHDIWKDYAEKYLSKEQIDIDDAMEYA